MGRGNEEGPNCTEMACSNDGSKLCALTFIYCILTMDEIDLLHVGEMLVPLRL
jgi:hypothetical protein